MKNKTLLFSIFFLLIFLVQLILIFDHQNSKLFISNLYYFSKPSITISLLIFAFINSKLSDKFSKLIISGLIFSLFGDCFLMLLHLNPNFFIFGLISFLIAHVFYIRAFYIDYKTQPALGKNIGWFALLFFGAYCFGFYIYLRPYLGAMKVPVMIYSFVISLMAVMAVNRKGRVNNLSFLLIFFGAMFFLISDTILAYNKFVMPFKYSDLAIMSTYMSAQYFITIGAVLRKESKNLTINPEVD